MKTLLKAAKEKKVVRLVGTNTYFNVYFSQNDNKVAFSPVGGGVVRHLKNNDDSMFEIVDEIPSQLVAGVFSIDGDPDFTFEGFANPCVRWNGWAMPLFAVDVAIKIADIVRERCSESYDIVRDNQKGVFIVKDKDWDSEYSFEDTVVNIDGVDHVVVGMFSGIWTWDAEYNK